MSVIAGHILAAAPAGLNNFMTKGGAIVILIVGVYLIWSGRRG